MRLDSALREEAPDVAEALEKKKREEEPARHAKPEISVGEIVRVPKWKSLGTILEIAGDRVKIALGTLQITLGRADIEVANAAEAKQLRVAEGRKALGPSSVSSGLKSGQAPVPPSRIDLRGKRLDDAMIELEHYIDQAFRSGALAEVTIVHGLGTGALRDGSRKLLAELPYVKVFRDAGAGQGGSGATIVEFER
jgi:DNA mismatch repair protein MutS2